MGVSVDANFPGGCVENVRFIDCHTIAYTAPTDGGLTNRSLWFYFRVCGGAGKAFTFVQEAMARTLEVNAFAGYGAVCPVVREGTEGCWKRIWQPVNYNSETLEFSFQVTLESNESYIAFCYPYQYADFLSFVGRQQMPYFKLNSIGKTGSGRDFPMLLVDDSNTDTSLKKQLVILTARQHAGESSASYLLEGILAAFSRRDGYGNHLRERCAFAVFPMVDLDGVEYGRYGKDSPPVDFNRDWRIASIRPEIRAICQKIEQLSTQYEPLFYGDIHCPQPGGYSYPVPERYSVLGDENWKRTNRFAAVFAAKVRGISCCEPENLDSEYLNWGRENYLYMAAHYFAQTYKMCSFTLEIAYHTDADGKLMTPEIWRAMGDKYAETMVEVLLTNSGTAADAPPVLENREVQWRNWEMVSLPRDVAVGEHGARTVVSPEGAEPFLWFTAKRPLALSRIGSLFTISCDGEAEITLYLYSFRGGAPVGRSKELVVRLDRDAFSMSAAEIGRIFVEDELCLSVRVNTLTGQLVLDIYNEEAECR